MERCIMPEEINSFHELEQFERGLIGDAVRVRYHELMQNLKRDIQVYNVFLYRMGVAVGRIDPLEVGVIEHDPEELLDLFWDQIKSSTFNKALLYKMNAVEATEMYPGGHLENCITIMDESKDCTCGRVEYEDERRLKIRSAYKN
jgi:hypothetical protein